MEFGVSFLPRSTETMVAKARTAEEVGFDLFGVADSQCIARELYTTLGTLGRATDSIDIGPMVTNPVTRHPVVTASSLATVNESTDGRAILGIGSGDSAVYTLGERPARLSRMRTLLPQLRSLWDGEEVQYDGESAKLRWVNETDREHDIPIFMAAEGPKTLATAGAIADRVVIGLGLLPEVVETAAEIVDEGARQAGRDPTDVEKWVLAQVNIAESQDVAIDEIKMGLGASAHHSLQHTFEHKCVPAEHEADLRELVRRYEPNEHEQKGESANKQLVEDLGLTEYLADRYAVVGTLEDCIAKLRSVDQMEMIDGVVMPAHLEEERNLVSRLGREVLPAVRTREE